MSIATPVYNQLLSLLNEHSQYRDLRHLKALAWMINALICSGTINLSEWEAYRTLAKVFYGILKGYFYLNFL